MSYVLAVGGASASTDAVVVDDVVLAHIHTVDKTFSTTGSSGKNLLLSC